MEQVKPDFIDINFGCPVKRVAQKGAGAGLLSAAIGALSGPVGIAIGIITALIAIGTLLYQNWDVIKAKCSEVWNNIKDTMLRYSKYGSNIAGSGFILNAVQNLLSCLCPVFEENDSISF